MKLIKSPDWGRILLPAFLLIILIQGVMYLPEVRVGLFPEKIWQGRLRLVAKGCDQVKESLISLEAELAALNPSSELCFSPDRNYSGNGRTPDLSQVVINARASTAQNSFEKHYYLARKKFVHTEAKLKNLELVLDNLLFSTTSQRLDGIPYSGNHDTVLIQEQIHALRQQCQQYANKLNICAKRLQKLRGYANKQIDSQAKVSPPEIEK